MIDVNSETLVPAEEAVKLPALRHGRGGRPTNKSTVFRWFEVGVTPVSGGARIKLDWIKLPGRGRFTTVEAVARFIAAINGHDDEPPATVTSLKPKPSGSPTKQFAATTCDLIGV